jgi:hypothetical protein
MARLDELLRSVSRHGAGAHRSASRRALALALCAMLALGGISPGAAFAAEADSEGEGGAPPGAAPEVEEAPEFEPGGEETGLEELPELAPEEEAGGAEDEGEGAPVEIEPQVEAELPPVGEEVIGAVAGGTREGEPQPPVQGTSTEGPSYEAAPPTSGTAVENQALSAPQAPPPPEYRHRVAQTRSQAPPPAPAPEAPARAVPQPAATPVESEAPSRHLAGQRFHIVQAGECLWSIAEAILPDGASNVAIANEVHRLWRLNASRIGTGDPSVLMAGTKLRLR